MTYGERFRQIRHGWMNRQTGKTVVILAKRLNSAYPSTIYNIERQWRVPKINTLIKHAEALDVEPWDLLVNVETEYDVIRKLRRLKPAEAQKRWQALLKAL